MASGIRTSEIADQIVGRLSEGTPLRQICRDLQISKSEVYRWKDDDVDFAGRIVRARDEGYDAIADECLAIADDTSNDTRVVGENEREVANTEWISRSKLRVETRLKLLAKWSPAKYGDKVQLAGEGGAPLTVQIVRLADADD